MSASTVSQKTPSAIYPELSSKISIMLQLNDDWSNWNTYKTVTLARLYSHDLAGHLHRNSMPPNIIFRNAQWYHPSDIEFVKPLDSHLIRLYQGQMDKYLKNEGTGTLILFETLPPFVFQKISHSKTLKAKWNLLEAFYIEIQRSWEITGENTVSNLLEDRWKIQHELLYRLQTTKYHDGPLVNHVSQIMKLRSKLASYDIEVTNTGIANVLHASVIGSKFEMQWPLDENNNSYAPFKLERLMEALFELEEMSALPHV